MIFDSVENIEQYRGLHSGIDLAIDFLKKNNLATFEKGKHQITNDIYVNIDAYFTKTRECAKLEAHRKYIDLQLMISGDEYIGYAPMAELPVMAEYDEAKDVAFYEGSYSLVRLETGMMAILFPQDLHAPCIQVNGEINVRKAVFKIKV